MISELCSFQFSCRCVYQSQTCTMKCKIKTWLKYNFLCYNNFLFLIPIDLPTRKGQYVGEASSRKRLTNIFDLKSNQLPTDCRKQIHIITFYIQSRHNVVTNKWLFFIFLKPFFQALCPEPSLQINKLSQPDFNTAL